MENYWISFTLFELSLFITDLLERDPLDRPMLGVRLKNDNLKENEDIKHNYLFIEKNNCLINYQKRLAYIPIGRIIMVWLLLIRNISAISCGQ